MGNDVIMRKNTQISHIKQLLPSGEWLFQSNNEHQEGVARLAAKFASEFGMKDWGRVLGLLHDKGKEQVTFQQHIKRESGYEPDIRVEGDYNHAFVGALIAKQLYPTLFSFLSYPIMGHHAGLHDFSEFNSTLKKEVPKDVNIEELDIELKPSFMNKPELFDLNHILRALYSCLVDADFLDTESFMNPEQAKMREGKKTINELFPLLEKYLADLKERSKETPVNHIRQKVQDACSNAAESEPGFYSLTVPTGGGKTLSSLLWAMKHAVKYGKKRIIIAIPYTSIIVQTASILREIFGEENVLEHHSNINEDNSTDRELKLQLKLATENWDYPIVVTTNVQLFESMYSNRPSDCRKLHNICNSVLILDEAQTLPIEFLQPIVNALKTYQRQLGTSVLFTTASQPTLEGTHINPNNPSVKLAGIDKIREIIPADFKLHDSLRRVNIHMESGLTTAEDIASEMTKHKRVLCIVNTRKVAQEIFSKLPNEGQTLHLSRMMCPKHVSDTIDKIKEALKSDEHSIIRVVATQLIEAGVDIDFPVVLRQEAGLDSVLQAAGRCNREGKLDSADAYVFSLGKPLPPGFITQTNNARKNMLSRNFDWLGPEAMKEYFRQLYAQITTFDKINIKQYLEKSCEFQFRTASEKFHLIDDKAISVIVNWKDSMDWADKLKNEGPSYQIMKQLSSYTVNIYERDFNKLKSGGLIDEIFEGIFVIPDREQYHEKVGLVTDNHWLEELLYA